MPVPSQGHCGFHSFPVVDWFCLFIYLWDLTFPLEDCSEFGNFVITLIDNETTKIAESFLTGDPPIVIIVINIHVIVSLVTFLYRSSLLNFPMYNIHGLKKNKKFSFLYWNISKVWNLNKKEFLSMHNYR